jgi:hypothetical protein
MKAIITNKSISFIHNDESITIENVEESLTTEVFTHTIELSFKSLLRLIKFLVRNCNIP